MPFGIVFYISQPVNNTVIVDVTTAKHSSLPTMDHKKMCLVARNPLSRLQRGSIMIFLYHKTNEIHFSNFFLPYFMFSKWRPAHLFIKYPIYIIIQQYFLSDEWFKKKYSAFNQSSVTEKILVSKYSVRVFTLYNTYVCKFKKFWIVKPSL